jgi:hypothetical protein
MSKKLQIIYTFKTIYEDGAESGKSGTSETEEEFTSMFPEFKDIFMKYKNCNKIHLEFQGYEWKQIFDIERIKI